MSLSNMALLLVSHFDCPVHHFNLGRRIPGFDYGPDGFGTGLTPLHLSDDGEGGTFHFHDPPPPYTAYKYPDIDQPDDPPPPYEASINPDSVFYDPAGASPAGRGSSLSPATLPGGPAAYGSPLVHRAVSPTSSQPFPVLSGFPFKMQLPPVGGQTLVRVAHAGDCWQWSAELWGTGCWQSWGQGWPRANCVCMCGEL